MGVDIKFDQDEANEEGGFTLEELRRIVDNMEQLDQATDAQHLFKGQWARRNNRYQLIGNTAARIPPGYYDTTPDENGVLGFEAIKARTDKLLRFPDAASDKVIQEIETFWTNEATFRKFGLPYKRGILLYGPPGSGKTSTLQLLARDVVTRGGIVLIYRASVFLAAYRQLRLVQSDTPVVVMMEDLDAILARHDESEVLNTLDGADVIDRVVFVATTNYPEELGERIINRPSRFDRRLLIGDPNDAARKMYLEDMTRGKRMPKGLTITQMVKDTKGMSLAHVKELFVATVAIKLPYEEALHNLKEMHLEQPNSRNDRDKFGSLAQKAGEYL